MKVRAFGRDLLLIKQPDSWEVYDIGAEGKKRRAGDIVIPGHLPPDEILQYLHHLLHEYSTPEEA